MRNIILNYSVKSSRETREQVNKNKNDKMFLFCKDFEYQKINNKPLEGFGKKITERKWNK